jgi:hypothetical protein
MASTVQIRIQQFQKSLDPGSAAQNAAFYWRICEIIFDTRMYKDIHLQMVKKSEI